MDRKSSLDTLLTEQPNPASAGIDARSTSEICAIINEQDRRVAGSVAAVLPSIAKAVEMIAARLGQGGRLFYIGAGTSGRLGVLDAAECRPTFNVPSDLVQGIIAGGPRALARATEDSEDDAASGAADLVARGFTSKDVLMGIAASGRTPYVLGAIAEARRLGAYTIGLSCTPNSELARAADMDITPLPGPEIITGSTRMKAGTATKLVLNMISTAVMIRLGYVYGNLMVNVQPTNEKLRHRGLRILSQATGVSSAQAMDLLEKAGSIRAAIVMNLCGVDRARAEELLRETQNRVSAALEKGRTLEEEGTPEKGCNG
ncbi:MAG: N-acetylmuramic acid 6-phosphate etherase [Acidobacteriia bacterium]|nr:N-acetylmuramic acid 6-phosphate etherase [Terriglobia bacterium]